MEEILPVVGLAQTVVFPGMTCTVLLGTVRALGAVREAQRSRPAMVALCATRLPPGQETEGLAPLHEMGVVAQVLRLGTHESGLWLAELHAQDRVQVRQILRDRPFRLARVCLRPDEDENLEEVAALVSLLRVELLRLKQLAPACAVATPVLEALRGARSLQSQVAASMGCGALLPLDERQALLARGRASERLEALLSVIARRIASYPAASAQVS